MIPIFSCLFPCSILEESEFSLIMLPSKNYRCFLMCVPVWLCTATGFVDGAAVAGYSLDLGYFSLCSIVVWFEPGFVAERCSSCSALMSACVILKTRTKSMFLPLCHPEDALYVFIANVVISRRKEEFFLCASEVESWFLELMFVRKANRCFYGGNPFPCFCGLCFQDLLDCSPAALCGSLLTGRMLVLRHGWGSVPMYL